MSQATPPTVPPGHYLVPIQNRDILVKDLNPAQAMLVSSLIAQAKGVTTFDNQTMVFEKMFRLIRTLIVNPEDLEFLEAGILDGVIEIADFAVVFIGNPNPEETPEQPKMKPRRGR